MTDTDKKPINFGYFAARYLHYARPFVELHRAMGGLQFIDGNIFVEPCATGGVHIAAVTGQAMAVFHDPDGHITRPCAIDVPDAAFDAAREPDPIAMSYCGESFAPPLPQWAQPGRVYVYDAGIHIVPKMRHPDWAEKDAEFQPGLFTQGASVGRHTVGIDYRMRETDIPGWRELLRKTLAAPEYPCGAAMAINPELMALFRSAYTDRPTANEKAARFWMRHSGTPEAPQATILRIEHHPEFIGLVMPQTPRTPHDIPAHFFFPAAQEGETRQ